MPVAKRPPLVQPSQTNVHFVLASLGAGGAERLAVTMGQRPPTGHQVGLILLSDVREYPWAGPVESLGVEVYSAQASPQRKIGSLLQGARRLRSRVKFEQPDACVSFTTWPNLLGLAACPRDVRSVITVHNVESTNVRGRSAAIVRAAIRRAYPRADAIIAVSEGVAHDLEEHFGIDREQVRVVHNPIDVAYIRECAKDATAPGASDLPQRPYLVHVGRHSEQKGLDSLLRIYAELRRQMPQAPQLVLVGIGPLTEQLMQLSAALGLVACSSDTATLSASPDAADVLFAGHRDNPFPWIANATVLVLPSLWEGFGLAPLEALALGTPVLLADCVSGPREILAPATGQPRRLLEAEVTEYGLLLPTTNQFGAPRFRGDTATNDAERVWADTLRRVLNEEERLLSTYRDAGPKRASDFDVEKIGDLWWAAVLGD